MRLRRRVSALLIGIVLATVAVVGSGVSARDAIAQESGTTGNINLFLGVKALDEDDWEPADSQGELGVEVDFRPRSWPINLVAGLRAGADEADVFDPILGPGEFESWTAELTFGVKKIWEPRDLPVRPYIGGGLLLVDAEATLKAAGVEVSDSDSGVGFWVGGGIYVTLAEHFNLGVDLRISRAEVEIVDIDVEAGGNHLGVFAGYHW